MRKQFTVETDNLSVSKISEATFEKSLEFDLEGPFFELLDQHAVTLVVSREYEHFVLFLGGNGGAPWQSHLPLPHPSGLFWDDHARELLLSSTRSPNQIFFLKPLVEEDYHREVVPAGIERQDGTLFLPCRSLILPGTLYIHDLVQIRQQIHATVTGHNFLARIDPMGGWEKVWWPDCVDHLGRSAFDQNYLQLNSIAVGESPETSFFTAFSDQVGGPKPWKQGYGPRGKGVVFSGATRRVMARGLTCPHSAKQRDGRVWLCNSGYGETGFLEPTSEGETEARFVPVNRTNGFTRGLAFFDKYAVVGLSRVIDFYEPYAPGLAPSETVCGLVIFDLETGAEVASLTWPGGYQIYDVQALPHFAKPVFPTSVAADGINHALRYLG
jgi:uncharacterized protein (TIGR03032 family)